MINSFLHIIERDDNNIDINNYKHFNYKRILKIVCTRVLSDQQLGDHEY